MSAVTYSRRSKCVIVRQCFPRDRFSVRRGSMLTKGVFFITGLWSVISAILILTGYLHIEQNDCKKLHKILEERNPRTFIEGSIIQKVKNSTLKIDTQYRPGEFGKPLILANLTQEQEKSVSLGYKKHAFNQYVSDLIPFNRLLPDFRQKGCLQEIYPHDLPPTSVIICFHNEAWSVLIRTVHSVLNRSPPHLIFEIILVDDFSDMLHLGRQLEDYITYLPKIRLLRANKREGLIRARLMGTAAAQASILTFLDSHSECTTGWLEPLLHRIYMNRKTVVSPIIQVIDDDTFEFKYFVSDHISVGGFNWNLMFTWHVLPEWEKKKMKNSWDPVRSPTMAGGYFAIDKDFFERLGTYDNGFDIWGAENLELSFKTWMCGGILEFVLCSIVGHVFRKRSPYGWGDKPNVVLRNNLRLAEVWLDDYKKIYYLSIGNATLDYGNIESRKKLRQDLKCLSFEWYLKNIYPDQITLDNALAYGELRSKGFGGKTCMDSNAHHGGAVSPYPCHRLGGNQFFILTKTGEIRREDMCLDYTGSNLSFHACHGQEGNQIWLYDIESFWIRQQLHGKCLELSKDANKLFMSECSDKEGQQWVFENYDPSRIKY